MDSSKTLSIYIPKSKGILCIITDQNIKEWAKKTKSGTRKIDNWKYK